MGMFGSALQFHCSTIAANRRIVRPSTVFSCLPSLTVLKFLASVSFEIVFVKEGANLIWQYLRQIPVPVPPMAAPLWNLSHDVRSLCRLTNLDETWHYVLNRANIVWGKILNGSFSVALKDAWRIERCFEGW